eukprot:5126584-Prymnesium_polylepis.1
MKGKRRSHLPHAPARLRVVAQHHALAQRARRARVHRLLDVHARRVHLIVEREALGGREAALLERQGGASLLERDHLAVLGVEEHGGARPREPVLEAEAHDALVRPAGDQRAGVDERVERRVVLRDP